MHLDLSLRNHQVFWQRQILRLKECWKAIIQKKINWRFLKKKVFSLNQKPLTFMMIIILKVQKLSGVNECLDFVARR